MRVARFILAVLVAFVLACILYLTHLLVLPFDPDREISNRVIGRGWTGAWKACLGLKVRVVGEENIREGGPFLFVSNHASYLDVLALYHDFPIMLRFLAKKTLVWVPIFGIAFYTLGHIYIDRRQKRGSKQSIAALGRLAQRGYNIFVFPGGKRASDGRLGEWKKGAFVLATQLQMPIVPLAISGSAALHGIGDLFPRPGTVTITIGKPISTAGATYEDRDRLLQLTRRRVEEMLDGAAA